MKKIITCLFIVQILIIISAGQIKSFDSTYAALLQSRIESYKTTYALKGISAAAYVPGQGMWLGVSGVSSETENITTDMLLGAGSITKNFMAAMILQLVEADSLSLNDSIGTWLPTYPNINNSITVRQLLDHTSGLYNMTDNPAFNSAINANLIRVWTAEEVLNGGYVLSPYFIPGSSWRYSNTNYLIAGYIVNKIMKTNISQQLHERFFTPLDMNESFFEVQDTITLSYAHNWYDIDGNGILDDIFFLPTTAIYSATAGAGGVTSRPENLVKWLRALYGGKLLNQTSLNAMLTFRPASISGANGYGLGTMRYNVLGINCYGHGGNIWGYTSVMIYDPVDSIAIAIMMNRDLNGGPIGRAFLTEVIQNNPVGINSISSEVPERFSLYQNYPNPFNPVTKINYELRITNYVSLKVYDVSGNEVAVLVNGKKEAGSYSVEWDASNYSSGVYYYRLKANGFSKIMKMALVK